VIRCYAAQRSDSGGGFTVLWMDYMKTEGAQEVSKE